MHYYVETRQKGDNASINLRISGTTTAYIYFFLCACVWIEVLRTSQPIRIMSSAVSLPNQFFFLVGGGGRGWGEVVGRLSPLSGLPVLVHILSPDTDNQQNDRRKYFVLYLNERHLPCPAGIEPATS